MTALTIAIVQQSQHRFDRLFLVSSNAIQVASPEYLITPASPKEIEHSLFSATIEMSLRQYGPEGPWSRHELTENIWGEATVRPNLPASTVDEALKEFKGGTGPDYSEKTAANTAIEKLGANEKRTAIVELTTPLTEEEIAKKISSGLIGAKALLLISKPSSISKKPLFWWPGFDGCKARGLPKCNDHAPISQFRQWVSLLNKGDERSLNSTGLTLSILKNAAKDGRIYGFILNWSDRGQLSYFIQNPLIRNIIIL
ncbi:hypothetical protein [Microtetraspora malaysiensis]|uniref:hypothetical protein n=1 Tax=Microtetraspora malaysiensis TaxID=161358 RepID=UPI0012F9D9C9|nr:hypothetical protein [Microtetraspora malaysiensis]